MSNTDDFVIKGGVLKEYKGNDEVLVIPEGVKSIGKELLGWRKGESVKKVIVPEGVLEIGVAAFSLSNIEEITLPATLTTIKERAFDSCKKLKSVVIPEGVTTIGNSAFYHSGIVKVSLPESVVEIGDCAFLYCDKLKEINIPHPDTLKIGSKAFVGCNALVDEKGLLIIQNRLFTFCKDTKDRKTVVVPDSVTYIEDHALDPYELFDVEMSVNCPVWDTHGTARVYGFANSVINRHSSTISFRDASGNIVAKVVLATEDETEPKSNGAILSIRQENGLFDFAGYDAYWAKLSKNPNKISVAIARLQYPYQLTEEMRDVYEAFIGKQSLNAGKVLIDENQAELLAVLSGKGLLAKTALSKLIEYANLQGKVSLTALLLATHNNEKNKPTVKKATEPKQKVKSMWKAPKQGTHLVGRYLGDEVCLEFPLKVDGVSIEGIANTAGETPENYKKIKTVIIPEGYTYIGNKAFAGCENLETILLPSTLREIGTQAFAGCKKIKEFVISKEISFVGNDVFTDSDIDTVVFESVKGMKVQPQLFFGCNIEKLVIVGGEFKSNGNVFHRSSEWAISSGGRFPNAVYTNYDFSTLDLRGKSGEDAKKIHPLAEFDETQLSDNTFKSVIAAEKNMKKDFVNNAEKIVESVKVEKIDFSKSVFVLYGFTYEQEDGIRQDVEQRGGIIKGNVSSKVNYLIVPDREILKNSVIKKVVELQKKGHDISIITSSELERHIHLWDVQLFGEEGAAVVKNYRISIEDGAITILSYIGAKENVVIPEFIGKYPVVALGKDAFSYKNGSKLKSVVIRENITELPKNLFFLCGELESVSLPDGLKIIGETAFGGCGKLKQITMPGTVTDLGYGAFSDCSKLKKVFIPSAVQSIEGAFKGCDALEEIVVEKENVKYSSGNNLNCVIETATNTLVVGCKTTTIPSSVTKIGAAAFSGMGSIKSFVVPEGVVEIGDAAFGGCERLESVELPQSLVKIGSYCFNFCSKLKKIVLPENLKEIGDSAFGNCHNLQEITIPDTLEIIGNYCVYNCKIKKVYGNNKSLAEQFARACRAEYIETA